jgi:hypothetical protein
LKIYNLAIFYLAIMSTIFVPSTAVSSVKTKQFRRFNSSSANSTRHSARNQNTKNLAVSYAKIEKALENPAPKVSFNLDVTKPNRNIVFGYSKPLVEIVSSKNVVKNAKSTLDAGAVRTNSKNARVYRVNRVFLRRVRRFRLESRRSTLPKAKVFNRTKQLIGRTSGENLITRGVSTKTVKGGTSSSSAIAIAGTNKTRTVYQSQTQPVGLHSAARVLSLVTKTSVSVHRVNGLTLARLGLDREKAALQTKEDTTSQLKNKTRNTNSGHLLAHLRETTGNRLGTSPSAVPDLVRLPFTALYIKAAPALAERLAHGLRTLPRQRKETAFLRSLIKLVKVLTALRPERLGLRIRLQGRVNR